MTPPLTEEQQIALNKTVAGILPADVGFIIITFPMSEDDIDPDRAPRKMACGFTSNAPMAVALRVAAIFGKSAANMLPDSPPTPR